MKHLTIAARASFAAAGQPDLLSRYNTYFRTQAADTPQLIESALAIRYQVYCLERKFENPAQHLDRLEKDEFDAKAVHSLIFHRPTGDAIGTVRLILPDCSAGSLPIARLLCEGGLNAAHYFPVDTTAEISRFAISNEFRRRISDSRVPFVSQTQQERRGNLPSLGLIQILLRQSLACGITHWAAVMEPKLLRMLAAMGMHFTFIGPPIFHHGLRQPSYCHVPELLERLRRERPDYWNIVTNAAELSSPVGYPAQSRAA